MSKVISVVNIEQKIFYIRGQKVMLDRDLAFLYGVLTKRLNEQVKRNLKRFPQDFMFELTREEMASLRSQIATSSWGAKVYAMRLYRAGYCHAFFGTQQRPRDLGQHCYYAGVCEIA